MSGYQGVAPASSTEPVLVVDDLCVAFPNRDGGYTEAVRGVSFTLGRERLGIVGESGSGKSQTGRAILGLTAPEGRVTAKRLAFQGTDLMHCSAQQRRALRGGRIAMVLQDPKFSLNPVMTIGEQIVETLRAHSRVSGAEARRAALAALEAVQIDDPVRVYRLYPHEVSGGMGQRAMIAMMLIANPELLIADEPTSAHLLRPDPGDVRRPGGRRNRRRRPRRCPPPLHAGPAQLPAQAGRCAPPAAHAGPTAGVGVVSRPVGLAVQGLRVSYDGFVAVADTSFQVEPGGSFGLVGESGSGKSTVLRAICGLAPLAAGSVQLLGEAAQAGAGPALPRPGSKPFRRLVQMVFQDPYGSLHPRQTVDRILAEPLAIHHMSDAEVRIERALDEVGLGTGYRFRYPHQLSGGQRQRIAIARALILEPQILLLDEPTSALDASVQAEVLNLLEDLRRRRGLTFVMVSHDLAVVTHLCERLMVMQRGQTVELVSSADLAASRVSHPYTRNLMEASTGFRRTGESP